MKIQQRFLMGILSLILLTSTTAGQAVAEPPLVNSLRTLEKRLCHKLSPQNCPSKKKLVKTKSPQAEKPKDLTNNGQAIATIKNPSQMSGANLPPKPPEKPAIFTAHPSAASSQTIPLKAPLRNVPSKPVKPAILPVHLTPEPEQIPIKEQLIGQSSAQKSTQESTQESAPANLPPLMMPKLRVLELPPPNSSDIQPPSSEVEKTCLIQLTALGVTFKRTKVSESENCGVAQAVQISALALPQNTIKFPDQPTLTCPFAVSFAKWLQEAGAPIAKVQAGASIETIATGPGFQCRGRNGDISAKISEHAKGNAVDIERLTLSDGRVFKLEEALNEKTASYLTLKGMRNSACGYFTTVLGPGANAAHASHLHFDSAVRGKNGNYRICQ